jgi:hypothetical protein
MTNWTDLLLDAAPVKAIFGPKLPTLEAIDLHGILLHRDGPRVELWFNLQEFPEHPPKKWVDFNRVQIQLVATSVQKLEIAGLQTNIKVDLSIYKDGPLIRLHADNGLVRFDIGAEFVSVQRISAYLERLEQA